MKKVVGFFRKIGHFLKTKITKTKILYGSLIVGFLAIGGLGGYLVSKQLFKEVIEYGNPLDYEDDFNAISKKFNKLNKSSDLSKALQPYELVNIALNQYTQHEYTMSQQFGLVNAMGVKQTIRATAIKNKSDLFLENISASSLVQAARRFYQNSSEVKDYEGKNVKETEAKWLDENCTTRNITDHETIWGKNLTRPLIYIISSKTVLSGSTCILNGDIYNISMSLDPLTSIIRYTYQMEAISGVSNIKFTSIDVDFEIDKDLNIKHFHVIEQYSVDKKLGVASVTAPSTGEIDEYFTIDQENEIPALGTNLNYNEEDYK